MKIHAILSIALAFVTSFLGVSDGFWIGSGTRIPVRATHAADARAITIANSPVLGTGISSHRSVSCHVKDNDDHDEIIPTDGESKDDRPRRRLTTARAGGRGPKKRPAAAEEKASKLPSWLLVPSLFGVLFLWALFGGNGNSGDSNYYYYSYSTTVFETQTYNPKSGQIETQRQESGDFKSNIPGIRNNNVPSKKYLDAFTSETLRAAEDLLDSSWE
jgi:hypothetical protein